LPPGSGAIWRGRKHGHPLGAALPRDRQLEPDQIGGYKPKKISGQHRDWLVQRCRDADFTLRGLVAELAERGLKVDYRTVWEFVHTEKLSHKKRH
jgi:putative transposase